MKARLITAAILSGALILYVLGLTSASTVTFVIGMFLELWFWVRVLVRHKRKPVDRCSTA